MTSSFIHKPAFERFYCRSRFQTDHWCHIYWTVTYEWRQHCALCLAIDWQIAIFEQFDKNRPRRKFVQLLSYVGRIRTSVTRRCVALRTLQKTIHVAYHTRSCLLEVLCDQHETARELLRIECQPDTIFNTLRQLLKQFFAHLRAQYMQSKRRHLTLSFTHHNGLFTAICRPWAAVIHNINSSAAVCNRKQWKPNQFLMVSIYEPFTTFSSYKVPIYWY